LVHKINHSGSKCPENKHTVSKTTKLAFSHIVTPFPVFEEHWDPNAVITLGDDQGRTLDVKLLELLCLTRTRYREKVTGARKRENDGLSKRMHVNAKPFEAKETLRQ